MIQHYRHRQTALKDPIIVTASKPKMLRRSVPPPDREKAYHITLTLPRKASARRKNQSSNKTRNTGSESNTVGVNVK